MSERQCLSSINEKLLPFILFLKKKDYAKIEIEWFKQFIKKI